MKLHLIAALLILAVPAGARTWTNAEGRVIEADFVSADEHSVQLRIKGKVTRYPLEKLSQADHDWIVAQAAKPAYDPGPANPVYAADIEAFIKESDKSYPFFQLKGIRGDWEKAKGELLARASSARSDAAFLGEVNRAIQLLRDGHMCITESKTPPEAPAPMCYPGVSFIPGEGGTVMILAAPLSSPSAATGAGTNPPQPPVAGIPEFRPA